MGAGTRGWEAVREDLRRLKSYVEAVDELYPLDEKDLDSMVEKLKGGAKYPKDYFHWALELARGRARVAGQPEFLCIKRLGRRAAGAVRRALELYYRIALMDYGLREALGVHPLDPKPEAYFKAWDAAYELRKIAWEMTTHSGSVLYDTARIAVWTVKLERAMKPLDEIDDYLGLLLEDYLKGSINDKEITKNVEQKLQAEKPPIRIDDFKDLAADVEECLGPEYVLPAIQLARIIAEG
ncbi:hypothetical protein [Pyrobaculum aerophilum]|uniref:Uncharacterized protein n=1 Tax=Pyrobaculum aerophilum TaxID=13773 RepID=A0A371QZG1_9CREN|nr:hypothetical protein [Pyrobaculum aerophilum]RFA95820.1 hypothetical protein CGL52_12220 [Pyrobaculum aerophilum]RFA96165.1 hypothetical protein CGL51_05725 [Pyrobaculum aerophilum]